MVQAPDEPQQRESALTADDFYAESEVFQAKLAISDKRFERTMERLKKLDLLDDIMRTLGSLEEDRLRRLEQNAKSS